MTSDFSHKKDPFEAREAAEYEHPVASREFIMQSLAEEGKPLGWNALCRILNIHTDEEQEGLRRRLKAMVRDGQLMQNRRNSYALVKSLDLVPGRVQGHRDGFGFLIPDDGSSDIFLPAREMGAVFNDDRVLVRITGEDRKGRREGQIAEIVERNTHQVVGKYHETDGIAFVDPDNKLITQDILISSLDRGGAKDGQFVMVEIVAQPTKRRQPQGKVIEILGDQLTSGMEVELAIRSHNLPFTWPEAVENEAQKFPISVTYDVGTKRKDCRALPFVTIDGEDAKDFDDAVFCEKKSYGWRLMVAIADVAEYVAPGSALDVEAKQRGNSVYFPNKVLPMLPESLSNGLCSLKPRVDRLALICEMQISSVGTVEDYEFYEGVIHSHARLTYTQVAQMLQKAPSSCEAPSSREAPPSRKTPSSRDLIAGSRDVAEDPAIKSQDDGALQDDGAPRGDAPSIYPHIQEFHRLFQKLLRQRQVRGAIDFDTVETKIIFGPHGKIERIVPVHRTDAHRMIEEAMLLANVSAADFLLKAEIATLYRVHGGPEAQRLVALRDFLRPFNLRLSGGAKPRPKDYSKLLERIAGRPDEHLLQTVLLRSLRQATYSPENQGHFGLAYDAYTHFTSPIRRYPDLLVHRAVKHLVRRKNKKTFIYSSKMMNEIGAHCSLTERRADLATREASDWLKCEFMLNKQGQAFSGIITDVTGFGAFIELNDIYVQGLLHITAFPNDYYRYDATNHLLQGRQSGRTYRIGDSIEVIVAHVDIDKRLIDFEFLKKPDISKTNKKPRSYYKKRKKRKR